ncbi:MAG: hypothetical protein ACSNEK_08980 [Parachlamydiaceae bacterium]
MTFVECKVVIPNVIKLQIRIAPLSLSCYPTCKNAGTGSGDEDTSKKSIIAK